jgi:hypothetical protein
MPVEEPSDKLLPVDLVWEAIAALPSFVVVN